MPDTPCNVVLVFEGQASRGNIKRRAWCLAHNRYAEECVTDGADPFATLEHLEAEAKPEPKRCPHCGGALERS